MHIDSSARRHFYHLIDVVFFFVAALCPYVCTGRDRCTVRVRIYTERDIVRDPVPSRDRDVALRADVARLCCRFCWPLRHQGLKHVQHWQKR